MQVSLHLHAPEVVVHPSANEIKKALARTARSLVESAKSFKRWMDGTCIESPDLPGASSPPLYGHTTNPPWKRSQPLTLHLDLLCLC